MKRYKKLLMEKLDDFEYNQVKSLVTNHKTKGMQMSLNEYVDDSLILKEDGIFGFKTCIAILSTYEYFDSIFSMEKIREVDEYNPPKEDIVLEKFLFEEEGGGMHFLKGEKGFTTPYGVYSYANPKDKSILYARRLYVRYGLNPNIRAHAYILDTRITNGERRELKDLALKLYKTKYIGSIYDIIKHSPKTFISFFSNSINGGLSRGYKSLQYSLGVTVDGKFGKISKATLKQAIVNGEDEDIALGALNYMAKFYCSLIRNNKTRYYRFRNGWLSRIRSIGYNRNNLC